MKWRRGCATGTGSGIRAGLLPLADHVQSPMPTFDTQVFEIDVAGLGDPQPEQAQHRDQRGVGGPGGAGGGDQRAGLDPVQPQHLGLLRDVGAADELRRGPVQVPVDHRELVEPGQVAIRRAMVAGA